MRTGVLWWALKATERLPWLTLERFYAMQRNEQVLILVYAQERDQEELDDAAARALARAIPIPIM